MQSFTCESVGSTADVPLNIQRCLITEKGGCDAFPTDSAKLEDAWGQANSGYGRHLVPLLSIPFLAVDHSVL
jgi:hypothetical protein